MSRLRLILMILLAASCWVGVTAGQASPIIGVGIIGDSFSDEYRGTDNRAAGQYATVTFNWNEQLFINRDINFGTWGEWGEPRRRGFEYNWSRSGATTGSVLSGGQVAGLAQQIRDGKISHVWMQVGINDFANDNSIFSIYFGVMTESALNRKLEVMLRDLNTAVETIQAAGPVKMVIVSVVDPTNAPQSAGVLTDEAGRTRITDAIGRLNEGIQQLAEQHQIYFVDYNDVLHRLNARTDENLIMTIGGIAIDSNTAGNEPHYAQLQDGHAGTVLSGLLANMIFIEPFNEAYDTNIPLFTDAEILKTAGITPLEPTAVPTGEVTPEPTSEPTSEPTPEETPDPSPPEAAPDINRYAFHTFVITWGRVTWAKSYQVQVAENMDFDTPVTDKTTGDLFLPLINTPNGQYFWRVRALDGNRKGQWSARVPIMVEAS